MKAISVRHPWAWAILNAGKDIENRSWKTNFRGTVAIHASQAMSRPYYQEALQHLHQLVPRVKVPAYEELQRGAIIGLVDIIGCELRTKSKWHSRGNYGFVLANPRVLRGPIPCNGKLGFWEVPDSMARRIARQLP